MQPKPAGEEAIAVRVVQHVAGFDPGAAQTASDAVSPHLEIVGGIADDGRLARGPRAGMHPSELVTRDSEEAEGVVLTQIGLAQKRELRQIAERCRIGHVGDASSHDGHVGPQVRDR